MPSSTVGILGTSAVAGLVAGFIALAFAAANEASLPVAIVAILSPGLRAAELVMPGGHESLGWTFGWFLRIAITVNALFYFVLFTLAAYLLKSASRNSRADQ